MDSTNITLWSETVTFPLLSTMMLVPLVAMVIVLLLRASPVLASRVGFVSSVITLGLSIYLLMIFDADRTGIQLFEQFHGYSAGVDGISLLFIPLTAVLTLVALIHNLTVSTKSDYIHIACLLGFECILIGAFSAMNALQFWFWCLLELIPVVLITTRSGAGRNKRWAVALVSQYWIGSLIMTLSGFLLLAYGVMEEGGNVSFDWLMLSSSNTMELKYGDFIFFLLFFGFATRMPLFPFHGWWPVLAEQGTMSSTGVFVVGLKLGVYAVIRYIIPIFPDISERWAWFVLVLGLIGIFYGGLLALMQINIRRLMAFGVISQTGMLIIGVFDFNNYGLEGSVLLSITYGLATAGVLFSIGMIYLRKNTVFIPRLGAMIDDSYAIAFLFVICALSTMVMPGTPGFDGAHLLIEGTINGYGWLVSIAILIGNVLAAALLLRAFQQIFLASSRRFESKHASITEKHHVSSVMNERLIAIIICSLLVGIGFYTSPWVHMIDQNIEQMVLFDPGAFDPNYSVADTENYSNTEVDKNE